MPGPIATIGSMHICPLLNPGLPPPPHVGGPISGPGASTVLAGGKMVAVIGDTCNCFGPPDVIVQGEASVLVEGKQVATKGDATGHGGIIIEGNSTVLVGTGSSNRTIVKPIQEIPIPPVNVTLRALAAISGRAKKLKEARAKQEANKKAAASYGRIQDYGLSL